MSSNPKFIKVSLVLAKTAMSKASLYNRLDSNSPFFDPTFPKQVKLSASPKGRVAWLESEINDWMNSRLSAR